jgi:hypothetical protein
MIVPLRYEMRNHLSQIAHAYGILLWARREYNVDLELVLLGSNKFRNKLQQVSMSIIQVRSNLAYAQ